MPTFLNPAPATTILAATGPHTVAIVVDQARAAEIAVALERLDVEDSRGRPPGYEYGRLELVHEIRAALERATERAEP